MIINPAPQQVDCANRQMRMGFQEGDRRRENKEHCTGKKPNLIKSHTFIKRPLGSLGDVAL